MYGKHLFKSPYYVRKILELCLSPLFFRNLSLKRKTLEAITTLCISCTVKHHRVQHFSYLLKMYAIHKTCYTRNLHTLFKFLTSLDNFENAQISSNIIRCYSRHFVDLFPVIPPDVCIG